MIGVVHLVWAPLGLPPLQAFLRSYHAHTAGAEHELVILLNGARTDAGAPSRQALLDELAGTEHRLIELDEPCLDLAAYGLAARRLEHEQLCFLGSYCEIRGAAWLAHLRDGLARPGVGAVATTGSWESQAEWLRGRARYWPYQLLLRRPARRDYPAFPNPHLRTSAFMAHREPLLAMGFERVRDKRDAYLLESGHAGITRRIQQRGERVAVVSLGGELHEVSDWPRSGTYRSLGQRELLISDNRTRDWEEAGPRLRRRLARDAFGADAAI